jgi:hypothetical protein
MNQLHHPPHVVSEAFARSIGIADPSRLYIKMAPNVWVIERRLSNDEMLLLGDFDVYIESVGRKAVLIRDLYKPVYAGNSFADGFPDYLGEPHPASDGQPVSWWLRPELIAPSERIRFPQLASKINWKEGLDLGDLRELYSWNGLQFVLRDEAWGRE